MQISDYYDGLDKITADNGSSDFFKISPSSAANFFTSTRQWFGENLLSEPGFEGSDSTILGTIVHFFSEHASLGTRIENPSLIVSNYLDGVQTTNRAEIEGLWYDMATTMIEGCIQGHAKPLATELFMFHQLLPGIYVGGTTDAIMPIGDGTVSIRDYKTASTKPSGIPYNYRLQAHIYAYLATKAGYNVSQIELQYVTRPTKTLPCRHFDFKEPFTSDDLERISGQLQLIAESVDFWNKFPEYRYLIAQDYRLKQPTPKKSLFLPKK